MRFSLTLAFSLAFLSAFSQWVIYPVKRAAVANFKKEIKRPLQRTYKNARVDSVADSTVHVPPPYLAPVHLPFFDDFTSSTDANYPDTTRWQFGGAVAWNFGLGKNPPSLGIVSFDGLDSLGNPYDVTNNLDKGYGDKLTSWTFRMDSIPDNERDSVFLSFFFEYQGNGEPPDPGDHLLVEFRPFKQDSLGWTPVAQVDVDEKLVRSVGVVHDSLPLTDTVFYFISIKVPRQLSPTDPIYFHDQFQFRISSFGRISGPWDTWNVDYVYLNTHRFENDISFPDRTIYSPVTSLFGDYWSVPAAHFHADSSALITPPSFSVTNLAQNQNEIGQPLSYNSSVTINEWLKSVPASSKTIVLDVNKGVDDVQHGILVVTNEHKIVTLSTLPARTDFTTNSDSIVVTVNVHLLSGDNVPVHSVVDSLQGDYLPKFEPVDFRVNDFSSATQTLGSYYAYDDGSAEFAAGLNQSGTEVAYRFDMITKTSDFLKGVDFYFPNVGDESAQSILLTVRSDTTDIGLIYTERINLQRSAFNRFIHHKFLQPILVQDHFYVGYQQNSAGVIAVGLDESHNTADKIFFNVQGFWETPDPNELQGSLMIHPMLGFATVSGLDDEPIALDLFPNPTSGSFYLSKIPDRIEILDFTGRKMDFVDDVTGDHLKISLTNAAPGMYILKASVNGKIVTRKMLVQQ